MQKYIFFEVKQQHLNKVCNMRQQEEGMMERICLIAALSCDWRQPAHVIFLDTLGVHSQITLRAATIYSHRRIVIWQSK